MRTTRRIPSVLCLLAGASGMEGADAIRFDSDQIGKTPSGWTITMTHGGGAPNWSVTRDETAPSPPNVLEQLASDATSSRFPLAILDGFDAVDGSVRVKFKAVSGKGDQAAGLVWRYRDADNYYIARANALENNVVLYKVEKGQRTAIAPKGTPPNTYGVKHAVPSGTWRELSVGFHGNLFTVSFNGQKLLDAEDSTFTESGKVGLWTKADSVPYFDDFLYGKKGVRLSRMPNCLRCLRIDRHHHKPGRFFAHHRSHSRYSHRPRCTGSPALPTGRAPRMSLLTRPDPLCSSEMAHPREWICRISASGNAITVDGTDGT